MYYSFILIYWKINFGLGNEIHYKTLVNYIKIISEIPKSLQQIRTPISFIIRNIKIVFIQENNTEI